MSYAPDQAVTYIVIHYTATPVEDDCSMADVRAMHRRRGFREEGYHYLVRKDGRIEPGRDLSEPGRFEIGAHSKGENDSSIGVCYEGGVTRAAANVGFDSRTPAQKKALEGLVWDLLERFPDAVVRGHDQMPGAATQCPGHDAAAWWREVAKRKSQPWWLQVLQSIFERLKK